MEISRKKLAGRTRKFLARAERLRRLLDKVDLELTELSDDLADDLMILELEKHAKKLPSTKV